MSRYTFAFLGVFAWGCFADPTVENVPPGPDPRPAEDGGIALEPPSEPVCGNIAITPTPLPVNLVISFDRSNSMKGKWAPSVRALENFFADPASASMSASLEFFCGENMCEQRTQNYSTPTVGLTTLPNTTVFAAAIAQQQLCFGTPLNPALQGAMNYAAQVKKPGVSTAVVLVSDGLPYGCGDLDSVVKIAKDNVATFPTYVIGVGDALDKLDLIAAAGGTNKAYIVQKNNDAALTASLQGAFNQIRQNAVSCSYAIPEIPAGESLSKVNVGYSSGGQQSLVKYDEGCKVGTGWRYDDPQMPKTIELCPSACEALKNDKSAKLDIVFGCNTTIL